MGNRSGNSELDLYRTCCFTGLRPQKLPFGFDEGNRLCLQIKERLKQEIIRLITEQHGIPLNAYCGSIQAESENLTGQMTQQI